MEKKKKLSTYISDKGKAAKDIFDKSKDFALQTVDQNDDGKDNGGDQNAAKDELPFGVGVHARSSGSTGLDAGGGRCGAGSLLHAAGAAVRAAIVDRRKFLSAMTASDFRDKSHKTPHLSIDK